MFLFIFNYLSCNGKQKRLYRNYDTFYNYNITITCLDGWFTVTADHNYTSRRKILGGARRSCWQQASVNAAGPNPISSLPFPLRLACVNSLEHLQLVLRWSPMTGNKCILLNDKEMILANLVSLCVISYNIISPTQLKKVLGQRHIVLEHQVQLIKSCLAVF